MAGSLKFGCVLVMCLVVLSAVPMAQGITCAQVSGSLLQCIPYLRGPGGPVSPPCCNGLRSLNAAASTTAARRVVCGCLKQAASLYPGLNPKLIASLPGKCGINIPYKIGTSTNCATIS